MSKLRTITVGEAKDLSQEQIIDLVARELEDLMRPLQFIAKHNPAINFTAARDMKNAALAELRKQTHVIP